MDFEISFNHLLKLAMSRSVSLTGKAGGLDALSVKLFTPHESMILILFWSLDQYHYFKNEIVLVNCFETLVESSASFFKFSTVSKVALAFPT